MAAHDRADQVAIIGRSGCGKSHTVRAILDTTNPARLLIWSPLEVTDNYGRYGQIVRSDIAALVARLAKHRAGPFSLVFVPDRTDEKRLLKHFDIFCGLALALGKCAPIRLVVEELSLVTKAGWSPSRWRMISTEGRHHGIGTIGLSQRPALIDKTFLSGATVIRCGALQSRGDIAAMSDILDIPIDDIRALRPGQWKVRDAYSGQVTDEGIAIDDIERKPRAKRVAKRGRR
jgi:hypothetical protein